MWIFRMFEKSCYKAFLARNVSKNGKPQYKHHDWHLYMQKKLFWQQRNCFYFLYIFHKLNFLRKIRKNKNCISVFKTVLWQPRQVLQKKLKTDKKLFCFFLLQLGNGLLWFFSALIFPDNILLWLDLLMHSTTQWSYGLSGFLFRF